MNLDKIIQIYSSLDTLRLQLLKELEFKEKQLNLTHTNCAKYTTNWNGQILKISIPEVIPHKNIKKDIQWKKETQSFWVRTIYNAINSSNISEPINFNTVFCYIKIFLPNTGPWDLDNRCIEFVINGIRYARLIKDDSAKYIKFLISGDIDKLNPRTEIYLTEAEKLLPIIESYFGKI